MTVNLAGTPSGFLRLYAATNQVVVDVIVMAPPDRSGSVGGWQSSERVGRDNASWFGSTPDGTVSQPARLDLAVQPGPPLETRIAQLYAMGQPSGDVDDRRPPSAIWLFGDVPDPGYRGAWKLEDLQLGNRAFRPEQPNALLWQELTLQLSTYTATPAVAPVTVKATRDRAGRRRQRTVVARRGDTLRRIAVRELGSSGQYAALREWNKKIARTDPDAPLRPGLHLTIK